MSLKLSGLNPLSYMGVEPSQPPQMVVFSFDPTENTLNFNIGSYWLNVGTNQTPQENLWILVSKRDGIATWLELSGAGRVKTLTSNSGGAVGPNAAGNINVVGDGITIVGVGTPGSNTITLSAVATDVVSTLTGNSGGAVSPIAGNINVVGDGVTATVVGVPGTHTLTVSVIGGRATDSFHTDNGIAIPASGVIVFDAITQSGSSISFSGAGNTVSLNTTDVNSNTIVGLSAGNNTITGTNNSGLGYTTFHSLTSGSSNVSFGVGSSNLMTSATDNTAIGNGSLTSLLTGSNNIAVGLGSGSALVSSESLNTLIGHPGLVGVSDFIGITLGAAGTNFIHNYGSVGRCTYVGAGAGNTTTSVRDNTGIGYQALASVNGNNGVTNVAVGTSALTSCTTGSANTAVGYAALQTFIGITTVGQNTGMGHSALNMLTEGDSNTAIGHLAGLNVTTGTQNTILGNASGAIFTTGSFNVIIGSSPTTGVNPSVNGAGYNYTGAESSNVLLQNQGVTGESNVIRIGQQGTGATQQNSCFIAGIRGSTTGQNNAIAVLVDSNGQLGTVSSSVRFKENIKDMGSVSKDIYGLRPVVFNYKNRSSEEKSYGLIAEEVHDTFPELVVYDLEGKPETVKYLDLIPMLLNETIKLRKELSDLKNSR